MKSQTGLKIIRIHISFEIDKAPGAGGGGLLKEIRYVLYLKNKKNIQAIYRFIVDRSNKNSGMNK